MVDGDRQLQETLKWLAGPVDRSGVWASIEARAGGAGQSRHAPPRGAACASRSLPPSPSGSWLPSPSGASSPSGTTGRPNFVLRITDDDIMGVASQPTTSRGARSGHWQRLLTNDGGTIKALFIDPKNPSVLYAETAVGLFKSSDGAESWNQTSDFSTLADSVILVAFDPASPSTVFVLTHSSQYSVRLIPTRLLRSDDGGATWTDLSEGSPPLGGWPQDIWFDTTSSPSAVYAMGWRSTDRGESWTELSPGKRQTEHGSSIRKSPRRTSGARLPTRIPAANSWSLLDASTPAIPRSGMRAPKKVCTSPLDGGATWKKASSVVWRVVLDPSSSSTLYAAASGGIFKSEDRGTTWSLILAGQGSVVIAPSSPSTLYAWTSAGLFRTDNGGATWSRRTGEGLVSSSSGPGSASGGLVLVSADNPDIVFAITGDESRVLSRSTDGGNTWSQVLDGALRADDGGLVVADPQDASTLFAATRPRRAGQIDGCGEHVDGGLSRAVGGSGCGDRDRSAHSLERLRSPSDGRRPVHALSFARRRSHVGGGSGSKAPRKASGNCCSTQGHATRSMRQRST